jgi:molecular chaperone DnaK
VTIRVFQGEREMAADNKILGQFNLENIPPAPRGMPQIEVGFDIDANGIVNVSAKDKATGKEQKITIQASGGLSDADVEKMVKDAEAHAEEDTKKKEAVDARNSADAMIFSTEKSLKEYGSAVSDVEKKAIEDAIADLKSAINSGDINIDDVKAKTEALTMASMKLGEAMYKAQGADAEAASGESSSNDDNIVDAEFEEVKDVSSDDKKKKKNGTEG